jgi:hypothetical protein
MVGAELTIGGLFANVHKCSSVRQKAENAISLHACTSWVRPKREYSARFRHFSSLVLNAFPNKRS